MKNIKVSLELHLCSHQEAVKKSYWKKEGFKPCIPSSFQDTVDYKRSVFRPPYD